MTRRWLGLDIGGANLKAADGSGRAVSLPFPVWQRPDELPDQLARLCALFPDAQGLAVTMTAELCDCFATRAEGVLTVLDAVVRVARGEPVRIWGTDGCFHDPAVIRDHDPLLAAASNWLATATLAAREVPVGAGLFIDIGSTTTDLISLSDGRAVPIGRTDLDRLRSGELVYAGVRRTPLFALAQELPWREGTIGLAAERFATTHDLYLVRGDLPPNPEDRDTADGRPATVACALGRIARMVGADRDTLSDHDVKSLACSLDEKLSSRLIREARRVLGGNPTPPPTIVIAGSGAFLARRVARILQPDPSRVLDLGSLWGADASHAAAAHAVAVLAAAEEAGEAPALAASATRAVPDDDNTGNPAVVLKLGGSLLEWPGLPGALADLVREYRHDRAVLVVGGGAMVDCLRDLDRIHQLGDQNAHELAIRTMAVTAHVAQAMAPGLLVVSDSDGLDRVWKSGRLPILVPGPLLDAEPGSLAASWDVTSDSIAAQLASQLGARSLVLLKSAPLPMGATREDAVRMGLVDPAFPAAAARIPDVRYRNLRDATATALSMPPAG